MKKQQLNTLENFKRRLKIKKTVISIKQNKKLKDGYVFTKGAASTAHPANVEFSQEHAYGLLNDKVPAGIRIVRTYSKDSLSN